MMLCGDSSSWPAWLAAPPALLALNLPGAAGTGAEPLPTAADAFAGGPDAEDDEVPPEQPATRSKPAPAARTAQPRTVVGMMPRGGRGPAVVLMRLGHDRGPRGSRCCETVAAGRWRGFRCRSRQLDRGARAALYPSRRGRSPRPPQHL